MFGRYYSNSEVRKIKEDFIVLNGLKNLDYDKPLELPDVPTALNYLNQFPGIIIEKIKILTPERVSINAGKSAYWDGIYGLHWSERYKLTYLTSKKDRSYNVIYFSVIIPVSVIDNKLLLNTRDDTDWGNELKPLDLAVNSIYESPDEYWAKVYVDEARKRLRHEELK